MGLASVRILKFGVALLQVIGRALEGLTGRIGRKGRVRLLHRLAARNALELFEGQATMRVQPCAGVARREHLKVAIRPGPATFDLMLEEFEARFADRGGFCRLLLKSV